jgi:hypothetical protein
VLQTGRRSRPGRLLVDSVAGFATRTPELRGALKSDAYRVTSLRCTLTGSPGICSTLGDVLEDDDEIDSAKWLPSLRSFVVLLDVE